MLRTWRPSITTRSFPARLGSASARWRFTTATGAEYSRASSGIRQPVCRREIRRTQARWRVVGRRSAAPRPGDHPLAVLSHFSGGGRRTATYLTTHLASHGYAIAAMDHSEVVAPELGPHPGESAAARARRIDAVIASRVPDVRLLLSGALPGRARSPGSTG
jgi:predicted dienelactone hydrolase